MRYALIVSFALITGCDWGIDNRLIYRQSIPSNLSHIERFKIEKDLRDAGWGDVEFIYGDRDTDIVVARKRRDA